MEGWPRMRGSAAWLDPRTKIGVLLIVNIVAMSASGSATAWAARSLALLLAAVLWLTLGRWRMALAWGLVFAAGLVVLLGARLLPGRWALVGGLGTMLVQFIPIVAMVTYAIASTQVNELVVSLRRLRLPDAFVVPMAVILRFLPTIAEEHRSIADAMRLRGIGVTGARRGPLALLEYRVVPLAMSLVRIGDDLTAAALTRGLGRPGPRTYVCRSGFGLRDLGVALAAMIPLTVLIAGDVMA